MRTAFLYFSLFVQLFFALPVLCEKYHVHSQNPNNCILSTGKEKVGSLVKTAPFGDKGCPANAVVDINPPISANATDGVVKGKSGKLYIGKSKDGKKLTWVEKPYKWQFNPGTDRPYHVITVLGESEIWLDNVRDPGFVEIVKAPLTGQGDAFWKFDKA